LSTQVSTARAAWPFGLAVASARSAAKPGSLIVSSHSLSAAGVDLTTALVARLTACRMSMLASWKISALWLAARLS
jgi:hypothetical protein